MSRNDDVRTDEAVLRAESEAAQAAMRHAVAALKAGLATAVDPKVWTRVHPLLSTGAAAIAGFTAARAAFKDKEKEMLRACLKMLREKPEAARQNSPPPAATAPSWLGVLFSGLKLAAVESLAVYGKIQARSAAEAAARAACEGEAAGVGNDDAADRADTVPAAAADITALRH